MEYTSYIHKGEYIFQIWGFKASILTRQRQLAAYCNV